VAHGGQRARENPRLDGTIERRWVYRPGVDMVLFSC
jgi:hypothetical protein